MRASIAALVFAAGCGDDITVTPDAPPIDMRIPDPAVITISATTADFGTQVIGSSSDSIAFTITNTGEADSGEINATLSGASGDFSIQDGCSTLAGGGTCTITATFTPTATGQRTATLTIDASPGGSVTAMLVGIGQDVGDLTIDPSSFSFPDTQVGTTNATTQTFTITNDGESDTGTLTVTAASADFDVVNEDCDGETLAPAASCTVEIAFSPTSSGPKSFTLTVQDGIDSVTAAIAGNGFTPALIVANPTAGNFPNTNVGESSSTQTFTFTNTGGQATGALSAATITGPDFDLVSETCAGVVLQPSSGNSCSAVVAFNPLTPGAKTGTLSVTGTPGGTANVALTGTGQLNAAIEVAPDTRAFGNVNVGQTATQVFTVTNTGAVPTGALATSITGDGQFSIVGGSNGCNGQVLAPLTGSCMLTVQYAPTGAGGAASATLVVQGTPGGTDTASLTGTGIVPAQFDVDDPESRDFGSVVINTMSAVSVVTVRNVGGVTSAVPSIAITGDFSQTNTCTAALAPNATCTISVRFTPTALGARTGSLTISGAGTPEVVALSGTGISAAQIVANPTTLTFALTNVGDTAATQTFTVTNQGAATTADLTVSDDSPDFTTSDNCGALANGQTCTVTVTYLPTASGTRQGTVTVTGNPGAGGTATVAVTGTARPRLEVIVPNVNPFDFGTLGLDDDFCQAVTIRNNTASQINVTESLMNIGTAEPTDYSSCDAGPGGTSCVGILAAGATCTRGVSYSPDTAGTHTSSITFGIDGATTGPNATTQGFTGTGSTMALVIAPCDGNCSQLELPRFSYPNTAVNTNATQVFTITNQSGVSTSGPIQTQLINHDHVGDGLAVLNGGFTVTQNNCAGVVLANNATCTLTVQFRPTTGDDYGAQLQVRDSAGGTNLALRDLYGVGVGAATLQYCTNATGACVSASTVSFAPTPPLGAVGTPTAEFAGQFEDRSFVVRNSGQLASGPVTLVRTNNDFAFLTGMAGDCVSGTTVLTPYTNPGLSTCPAGATCSCNVRIRYTPTAPPTSVNGPDAAANDGTVVATATPGGSSTATLDASKQGTIEVTPDAGSAFGNVVVGVTEDRVFTIENNSAQTVQITSAATNNAQFTVVNNMCGGGLMPFNGVAGGPDECDITVRFLPSAVGNVTNVTLTVNGTNGVAQATGLSGNGRSVADLVVTPTSFNFGSVLAGGLGTPAFSETDIVVTNAGFQDSGPITVALAAGSSTAYSIQAVGTTCVTGVTTVDGADGGAVVAPQVTSCNVRVRFAPGVGQTGALTGTLTVSGTPGGTESVALTGNGLPNGSLTISPTFANFGSQAVGTTSAVTTFTVQNTSGSSVTLTNTLPADFQRAAAPNAGTCGATLAAGTNCTFGIVFAPTGAAGPRGGNFTPVAGVTAALQGVAITNANIAGFVDIAFGQEDIGGGVNSVTATITNNNAGNSGVLTIVDSGAQADQFDLGTDGCNGTNLAPGGSCEVEFIFDPSTTGPKTATVTLTSDRGLSITRTFTGTGVNNPNITLTPDVGTAETRAEGAVDGAPTIFTITNEAGAGQTGDIDIFLSGDTDDFVLVTAGATPCDIDGDGQLANGASCTFGVLFNPANDENAGVPAVPPTKTVTITADIAGDPAETSTLTGTVTPLLSGPPATQTLTANQNLTLTYTNNASVTTNTLVVNEATLGSEISVISDTCTGQTVAAGGTCAIVVRYIPNGSGLPPTGSITVTGSATVTNANDVVETPSTTLTTTFN